MKKQVIRLTEGDLHRIIKESVNRILKEDETYVDKLRRQNAEKKASWDAWENTVPYTKDGNLPTELDKNYQYNLNKSHHEYISDDRPEKNGFRTYTNFAKEDGPYTQGFKGMQALYDKYDFYRDGSFWNGIKK